MTCVLVPAVHAGATMGVTMSASAAPRTVLLDDRKVIDMRVRGATGL